MNEHHKVSDHRNVQDMDRVIANYGRPPSDETKQKLREALSREKENFLSLERMKSRTDVKAQEFDRDR